jgi:NADH dehydrogenase
MTDRYVTATVFGGSGFLGRHLIRRLARTGCIIRVPTRDVVRAAALKTAGHVGQIVPMHCNVRSDESVAAVLQGSDLVINLIGTLAPRGRNTFGSVHAEAAERIARLAAAAGARRLVHVSAIGADPASPSAYARSKAEGERLVSAAFPGVTILRPSIVFGPEDQFFNKFAGLTRIAPALPLIGGGRTRFQPVYVGDVADAAMAVLARPDTRGLRFELGGPRVYSFRELMQLVLTITGRHRGLVSVPWGFAALLGSVLQLLPNPLLTRDQVRQLGQDNVVGGTLPGLADLGIAPTAAEAILPTYLDRFRVGGRFAGTRTDRTLRGGPA